MVEMGDARQCLNCLETWFDPCGGTSTPLRYCPNCETRHCRKCGNKCNMLISCVGQPGNDGLPAHEPMELDAKATGDQTLSLNKIKRTTKRCPGLFCGILITKESGCDYIQCK